MNNPSTSVWKVLSGAVPLQVPLVGHVVAGHGHLLFTPGRSGHDAKAVAKTQVCRRKEQTEIQGVPSKTVGFNQFNPLSISNKD